MIDGNWLAVKRTDPRAFALYRRHYSFQRKNNGKYRDPRNTNVAGPAETATLLSRCERALFLWIHNTVERFDHQEGVNCAVFRNEGAGLSSDLIREADELAWQHWPAERRHFTYVDGEKTRRGRSKRAQPGECFIQAGWSRCGQSKDGLVLLEIVR